MKTIISTGQGRLHLIESARAIKKAGVEVEVITGWVPSKRLPDKFLNSFGRIVGHPNIAYGLRKRQPAGLEIGEIKTCGFSEFFMQFLFLLSNFKIIKRDTAVVWGWKTYGWQSKKYLKNAQIFHVRSGAGYGGAMEKAKQEGMVVLADHSAAHPLEIYNQLSKAYEDMPIPFNPNAGLWKFVLDDCKNADAILVNSDYVKNSFIDHGFNSDRIFTIPLGIRSDFFSLKSDYKISKKIKLLYTGSFRRWKGSHLIIGAIEKLIALNIEFKIDIIGTVSSDLFIPEWFSQHPDINIHGHMPQDNLKNFLSNSDIYIFPSYCEGAAQSLKEAMAAALPVVATFQSGAPIIDGENGLIIPDHSSQALVAAILLLSKDEKLRQKLGTNAAETIKKEHTWEHYGEQTRKLYSDLLSMKK